MTCSNCNISMVFIFGDNGLIIGYRCPRCGREVSTSGGTITHVRKWGR